MVGVKETLLLFLLLLLTPTLTIRQSGAPVPPSGISTLNENVQTLCQ